MDDITGVFGENLRKFREKNNLSLDKVSRLCGVSKSMLGQIERGTTSPTISTVWKITNGLKITFTDLMTREAEEVEVVDVAGIGPLLDCGGKYRNYPLFPFARERPFEIYNIEIDPGAFLSAKPHPPGTEEYVVVQAGELAVTVGGKTYEVGKGSAIRFPADREHGYRCLGEAVCRLCMVIHYRTRESGA